MQVPSPGEFTDEAADRLVGYGDIWSDERLKREFLSVTHDELIGFLDSLDESQAHALVFEGTGE